MWEKENQAITFKKEGKTWIGLVAMTDVYHMRKLFYMAITIIANDKNKFSLIIGFREPKYSICAIVGAKLCC